MKIGGLSNGIVCGIGAYALWGLFPLYWKLLQHISVFELIGHRIVWSFSFLPELSVNADQKRSMLADEAKCQ